MVSLRQGVRRVSIAMVFVVGFMFLTAVVTPLLSDELASTLPGITDVLAEETAGDGG